MYLCAVTMNIFQAECLQLLTRQGRYVADSEVVGGEGWEGSRREEQIRRRFAPRNDKRGEGARSRLGGAKVWFSSFYSTDLGWCFC